MTSNIPMFRNRVLVLFAVALLAFMPVGSVSAGPTPLSPQDTAWRITGTTGIAGVTLSYYENGLKTVASGSGGSYNILVPDGWTGTVTPSLAGYTFTPAWRAYVTPVTGDETGQDYVSQSANANLGNLVLSSGALAPAFAYGTLAYTSNVAFSVTSLTVTPTAAESHATITVNGTAVASGSASGALTLNVGANTITIVVTAQNGTTTVTYTVTVTRAAEYQMFLPVVSK